MGKILLGGVSFPQNFCIQQQIMRKLLFIALLFYSDCAFAQMSTLVSGVVRDTMT